MSDSPRILIAGIGNIFLGDDAFGSEVAQRLLRLPQLDGVRVIDFGIRGLDLLYALAQAPDLAILIDAVPRGESPGTLFLLEPQIDELDTKMAAPTLNAHSMDPLKVLRSVASMGTPPARTLIVGCEPTPLPEDENEMQLELTAPVRAAVDEALTMVQEIVSRFIAGQSDKLPTCDTGVSPVPAAHYG
jgi:hydrogenase maturation protease